MDRSRSPGARHPAGPPPRGRRATGRRQRRRRRALPLLLAALAAFVAGAAVGGAASSPERAVAARFAEAWARGDLRAMYAELDPEARRTVPFARFRASYAEAAATATQTGLAAGKPGRRTGGVVPVPVQVRTAVWGTVPATLAVPVTTGDGRAGVAWSPALAFPGLRPGERLRRETALPARAALLAATGTPLAAGPARSSPLGAAADAVTGELGPIPATERDAYRARGYPPEALVGVSGFERTFERALAGRPGGRLLAGARVLAEAAPRRGRAVRVAIEPAAQRAAVDALAGRLGGIAVLRPATGAVLALSGLATSAPQPPGSTFKIVTAAAALEAGLVTPSTRFPRETAATLSGVELQNAHGELCGGTFAQAFADSCNSVFAPLGARLGAERLVVAAERFGFNAPPPVPGAARSTLPPAREIGDDLALGSTAIGQGRVLATALQMALVAATVAAAGRQARPQLEAGAAPSLRRVVPPAVAATLRALMVRTVRSGTGRAAALPGTTVAGKTGTAELGPTQPSASAPDEPPAADDPTDTDAWFVAFAPAASPRVAVAVLLVRAGAGGDTAAPAAREVLAAALGI
jgi:cell division protein FtsI/penicillin-binding protein 2